MCACVCYNKIQMLRKKLKLTEIDEKSSKGKQKSIKSPSYWKGLYEIECRMNAQFNQINFIRGQVAAVYNPVEYAAELHCAYLEKYLTGPKNCLFIGMNPGPWGMVQTGVNTNLNLESLQIFLHIHHANIFMCSFRNINMPCFNLPNFDIILGTIWSCSSGT